MAWTKFKSDLHERLRDVEYSALYLQTAREEDGDEGFNLAMREVLIANGGMTKVASDTHRGRTSLYKSFSKKGNPSLKLVMQALDAAGLRFQVVPQIEDARLSHPQEKEFSPLAKIAER